MRKLTAVFSTDLLLLTLFVAIVIAHLFRINVEATGYLTPDSRYYLELANSLQQGKGFYITDPATNLPAFFTVWPIGYPVLIYLVSQLSMLSLFWSSKLLNFLLLGFNFLLLRRLNRKYAFVLASIFCSYTLMEVYSFTWSEAPFISGLLFLAYLVSKPIPPEKENKTIVLLLLACLYLFLIRYIGAFSFGVVAFLAVSNFYRNRPTLAVKLAVAFVLLCLLMLGYLAMNYYFSGSWTGTGRLEVPREPTGDFMLMLTEALLNELLLIRKYRSPGDFLFIVTICLQASAIGVILFRLRGQPHRKEYWQNSFSVTCMAIGLLYLLAIVALRFISRFDDLDYRLLSPFSALFFVGILYALVTLPKDRKFISIKYICFAFFLFSLLLNLPKQYILNLFTGLPIFE